MMRHHDDIMEECREWEMQFIDMFAFVFFDDKTIICVRVPVLSCYISYHEKVYPNQNLIPRHSVDLQKHFHVFRCHVMIATPCSMQKEGYA